MSTPKRLFFDIEVSYCVGWFWRPGYNLTIPVENIFDESAIICICYKWEGQRKVHSLTWDAKQSDRKMLIEFIKILKTADEIVGHNGDKFDLAWIRTRCLFHRIEMFPDYKTIDTLKISRSKFRFNSNKLDYIAKFLGFKGKKKLPANTWIDVVRFRLQSALSKMVAYCKRDVTELENVYLELSKHVESKVHHGVLNGKNKRTCPNCGSHKLYKKTVRATKTGMLRGLYRCEDCTRHTTMPLEKEVTA